MTLCRIEKTKEEFLESLETRNLQDLNAGGGGDDAWGDDGGWWWTLGVTMEVGVVLRWRVMEVMTGIFLHDY